MTFSYNSSAGSLGATAEAAQEHTAISGRSKRRRRSLPLLEQDEGKDQQLSSA